MGFVAAFAKLYAGEPTTASTTTDTIQTRIENPDGDYWVTVYQMIPPIKGDLECDTGAINVDEFCRGSNAKPCIEEVRTQAGIAIYRAPLKFRGLPVARYIWMEDTLVVFVFHDDVEPEDLNRLTQIAESMRPFSQADFASVRR
jgi:hypothetical protein